MREELGRGAVERAAQILAIVVSRATDLSGSHRWLQLEG